MPHYNTIQLLTNTLRLRAVAELAAGRPAEARRDIALMLRLRQTIEGEPTLISGLVDLTCLGVLIQPIWEGLAARQWSAEDLDALRDGLRGINVLREFQQGMRCERAFSGAEWPEELQGELRMRDFGTILSRMTNDSLPSSWFAPKRLLWEASPWMPRGWIEQNSAFASRYLQDYGIDSVDPVNRRLLLAKAKFAERTLENIPVTPYTFIAQVALPVFASVVKKFAQTQAILDQAMAACALEKYYLDHHTYPAALSALVPTYLDRVPGDVIDGAPHALPADGRWTLPALLGRLGRQGRRRRPSSGRRSADGDATKGTPAKTNRRSFPSPSRTKATGSGSTRLPSRPTHPQREPPGVAADPRR